MVYIYLAEGFEEVEALLMHLVLSDNNCAGEILVVIRITSLVRVGSSVSSPCACSRV